MSEIDLATVVRVTLLERGAGEDATTHVRTFVLEHAPDIEGIKTAALRHGWGVEIHTSAAVLVGGNGAQEIEGFMADADTGDMAHGASDARLNKIERDQNSFMRQTRAQLDELRQLIISAVQGGDRLRGVNEAGSAIAPARPTMLVPIWTEPSLREQLAATPSGRRPHAITPTPEMEGNPDFKSNSMALVGVGVGSQIFSAENGVDSEGLPKASKPGTVGDTLTKGTRLA